MYYFVQELCSFECDANAQTLDTTEESAASNAQTLDTTEESAASSEATEESAALTISELKKQAQVYQATVDYECFSKENGTATVKVGFLHENN